MRFVSLFVATAFFSRVIADCCDEAGGISGECADGTDATPCCGVGSCNLFCCNCDGGCRQGDHDGTCMAVANGVLAACLVGAVFVDAEEACELAYEAATAACGSNKKRSVTTPVSPLFARDGPAAPVMNNSSPDLFDRVDTSGNGNISISEYLRFVNYTTRGSLNDTRITSQWIKWFKKFDKNGDNFVVFGEHDFA